MGFPLLTVVTFIPLLGALVVLLTAAANERAIKGIVAGSRL